MIIVKYLGATVVVLLVTILQAEIYKTVYITRYILLGSSRQFENNDCRSSPRVWLFSLFEPGATDLCAMFYASFFKCVYCSRVDILFFPLSVSRGLVVHRCNSFR